MDSHQPNQQTTTLLHAIAISSATSPHLAPLITPHSRTTAFTTLEQFKSFPGRIPLAVSLLQSERHSVPVQGVGSVDVTAPTKMYVLGILQIFLKKEYSKLVVEGDRLAVRGAIMTAARQLLAQGTSAASGDASGGGGGSSDGEMRYLAVKIATLIADVAIRDFPQRWTSFISDIFQTPELGGLWVAQPYDPPLDDGTSTGGSLRYGPTIGIKIALETLSRIIEDCTDGDFNAKVSTARRSDVLIGLNEVHTQFLPHLFHFLSQQYAIVSTSKGILQEMANYVVAGGRTLQGMTVEERGAYDGQCRKRDTAGRLVLDCLGTVEKCCQSMPTDWMLGGATSGISAPTKVTDNNGIASISSPNGNSTKTTNNNDFLAALLHLLREDTLQIQVAAVSCLQFLVLRKLEIDPWLKLMSALSKAVAEAHEVNTNQNLLDATATGQTTIDSTGNLVKTLPFHRGLSKLLSTMVSGQLAHISTDKDICTSRGSNFLIVSTHLNLMAEMLAHPSPRICGEQTSAWIVLLRDPTIAKTTSRLLQPYLERVLSAYIDRRVKVRWEEDIVSQTHVHARIYEESFDDKEEYDIWIGEFRSRASQMFKLISAIGPKLAAGIVHSKTRQLFALYGSGVGENGGGGGVGGRDYLDAATGQLTQFSTAVIELEGLCQPLDTILQGLPLWALDNTKNTDPSYMEPHRVETRNAVRSCLAEVANMIVSWNPVDTWLKFRRAMLLDALKYYWRYDQTTLPMGVDALLTYLGAESPSSPPADATSATTMRLSDDIVSLRKKSGGALISVSKRVPHLLVTWLDELSHRAKSLLSCQSLLPTNKMHLIEFLSCVATAVQDPVGRSNFVSNVLSEDLMVFELPEMKEAMGSPEGMLTFLGIAQAGSNPLSATDTVFVKQTTANYVKLFSAFNHLLSVGKRCHQAARKRPNGGIPLQESVLLAENVQLTQLKNMEGASGGVGKQQKQQQQQQLNFPDEGSVSLKDLELNDPFVPLWPRILPYLIRTLDVLFTLWQPRYQGPLLKNAIQRYAYSISDDEAYLAKNQGSQSGGGVFGEGGTAGSVVNGYDRRGTNLAAKWSYWFNELRNTCIQLLGLLTTQRALFAPELANVYPDFVNVIASPLHLQAMEHRHISQYIKQFMDYVMVSCPSTLYQSHLAPILKPFFQHVNYRLQCTWAPIQEASSTISTKPLSTNDCDAASEVALRGGDEWFVSYYARGGLFVGDLDIVTGEAAVEKVRVELSRCFSDMLQAALALKGDWALVLATLSKEEQALKRNDTSRLTTVPSTKIKQTNGPVNADGTPRSKFHLAIEARKTLRIRELCRFLLLGDENIAGFLVLNVFQCLAYPDAYTCRRCTRMCHRILEVVAWADHYTNVLVQHMFLTAVRVVVSEPKWMVGLELDMISLIRNTYCRLVLGQTLLPGGQGPGLQHALDSTTSHFEQSKTVDTPLQGGGILCVKSDLPRKVLSDLPGISPEMVLELEQSLLLKRTAKEQKDALCDLMRIAAENVKESEGGSNSHFGVLGRATASESLLNRQTSGVVLALPEKLITHSMIMKQKDEQNTPDTPSLSKLFRLS